MNGTAQAADELHAGSVFSGIGGLDRGLARAGFQHAFLCESDAWRRDVLAAHFPGVPIYEDVRDVGLEDGRGRAEHDDTDPRGASSAEGRRGDEFGLLCGGFPCQDVSVAGRRAGLAGARSGLFYEFARIADTLRPRWLLVENVPGLLSSQGGRDFGAVLGTLADLGYGLGWRILDSRYFGVPQRRRRVFIVGALADGDPRAAAERAGQVLAVGSRCPRHPATRGEARTDVAPALAGRSASRLEDQGSGQLVPQHYYVEDHENGPLRQNGAGGPPRTDKQPLVVAAPLSHGSNPNSNMAGRRREDDENLVAVHMLQDPISDASVTPAWGKGTKSGSASIAVANGSGVRRLTPTECERLQALPDGWTNPTGDAPDSRRYAALGDAVTASVAEWIGRRIIAAQPVSQPADPLIYEHQHMHRDGSITTRQKIGDGPWRTLPADPPESR